MNLGRDFEEELKIKSKIYVIAISSFLIFPLVKMVIGLILVMPTKMTKFLKRQKVKKFWWELSMLILFMKENTAKTLLQKTVVFTNSF